MELSDSILHKLLSKTDPYLKKVSDIATVCMQADESLDVITRSIPDAH